MLKTVYRTIFLACGLSFVLVSASTAEDRDLGSFRDWNALSFSENDNPACMMWSEPKQSSGEPDDRLEVFLFVTHRPADKRLAQVSFETGYAFAEDSEVEIEIGDARYTLYTNGTTAWTNDPQIDLELVAAMRAGQKMTIKGSGAAGVKTTDTFSLFGFTAANKAIDQACSVGQ